VHDSFLVSFSIIAAGTLVAVLSTSAFGVIAGMVIYGFGIGWLVPNLITSLGEKVSKARQGRAAGFVKAAHFMSAPIAVTAMEPFARRHGPEIALLVVLFIAVALIALIGIRKLAVPRSGQKAALA
jgi:MFS family permease